MQFELTTKLEEKDYIEINQGLKKKREKMPKWLVILLRIFILLSGLTILLIQEDKGDLIVASLLIFFALFYEPLINYIRVRTYKKVYQSSVAMQENSTYLFNEESIKKTSSSSNAEIKWSAFNEILEIDKYYLLMTSKLSFVPINKKQINDEQANWIKSKVTQKK